MSRILRLLLISPLLAAPLLAQKAPQGLDFLTGKSMPPASSVPATRLAERAFFSLAGELVPPGVRELTFEIRIDGRTALTDVLRLPLDAAGGTFELLAGDPRALARLFARAEKDRRAEITVKLDGRTLRTFSLPDFLAYNRQFQDKLPSVRNPLGETRTFAPEPGAEARPDGRQGGLSKGWDTQCLANCDTNRDYCYQTEPSCYAVDYCDVCENQWSSCRNGCWVCEEPKSVSQYTSSWIKSASWAGGNCLYDASQSSYWYDFYNLVIENDRYQRTEHCDGSHTDTFLYSWDTYGSCMRQSYWQTCSYPAGSSYPPYCY
jgi:hypothetical protein